MDDVLAYTDVNRRAWDQMAARRAVRGGAFFRDGGSTLDEVETAELPDVGGRTFLHLACANGSDALYLAMAALKVKSGDEVITTAHSWISTSAMITHAGATVVFCDTDGSTFTIDPAAIEAAITPRTVGIIPVHLYGQPADMDAIMAIARRHKLWVIEDCAQAHLARYKGRQVGTFGAAATYSFYPGKNLGAMGDAGAVVTSDGSLAEHMTMLARHGGLVKHQHHIEGINSRLDGMQAAILSAKLPHLPAWTEARQNAAKVYDASLNQIEDVTVPQVAHDRSHVYHLYTIRHPRRDALAAHLNANGVQTAINYPTALPFLAAYQRFGHRPEQFPHAFGDQGKILSLPMFAEITRQQQEEVIGLVRNF
jgi:dTDP-4-amino-4,6-dideoxygalactose transaminase